MNSSYILSAGDRDKERLVLLNELFNPTSIAALELAEGLRILTIGCGIGLLELEVASKIGPSGYIFATDSNPEQLAIAKELLLQSGLQNVQFAELDISRQLDCIEQPFDRIHCRLVLSHLPWETVQSVLPAFYHKLIPGGLLLLEEIATLDSQKCEPHSHPGYDRWSQWTTRQFATQNSHPRIGYQIEEFLKEKGFFVEGRSYQPVLRTPKQKSILRLGICSAGPKFCAAGHSTLAELEEASRLLEQLEQASDLFPRYTEIRQIIVRSL